MNFEDEYLKKTGAVSWVFIIDGIFFAGLDGRGMLVSVDSWKDMGLLGSDRMIWTEDLEKAHLVILSVQFVKKRNFSNKWSIKKRVIFIIKTKINRK